MRTKVATFDVVHVFTLVNNTFHMFLLFFFFVVFIISAILFIFISHHHHQQRHHTTLCKYLHTHTKWKCFNTCYIFTHIHSATYAHIANENKQKSNQNEKKISSAYSGDAVVRRWWWWWKIKSKCNEYICCVRSICNNVMEINKLSLNINQWVWIGILCFNTWITFYFTSMWKNHWDVINPLSKKKQTQSIKITCKCTHNQD